MLHLSALMKEPPLKIPPRIPRIPENLRLHGAPRRRRRRQQQQQPPARPASSQPEPLGLQRLPSRHKQALPASLPNDAAARPVSRAPPRDRRAGQSVMVGVVAGGLWRGVWRGVGGGGREVGV